MYEIIKHLHPLIAVISVLSFNYRFWSRFFKAGYVVSKKAARFRDIIDSLLLLTGILLVYFNGSGIIFSVHWFDFKLLFVFVYIILAVVAMKSPRRSTKALVFYALSMLAVLLVIFLVKIKPF